MSSALWRNQRIDAVGREEVGEMGVSEAGGRWVR